MDCGTADGGHCASSGQYLPNHIKRRPADANLTPQAPATATTPAHAQPALLPFHVSTRCVHVLHDRVARELPAEGAADRNIHCSKQRSQAALVRSAVPSSATTFTLLVRTVSAQNTSTKCERTRCVHCCGHVAVAFYPICTSQLVRALLSSNRRV